MIYPQTTFAKWQGAPPASSKRLVIYGTGTFGRKIAREIVHLLSYDTESIPYFNTLYTAADEQYIGEGKLFDEDGFRSVPCYPFENIDTICPPGSHLMLVVYGGSDMEERKKAFFRAKEKGYEFASYIHPSSTCYGYGRGTYGENLIVFENCVVDSGVTLGDNVMIRPNSYIGHDSNIGSHSFIAPGSNLSGRTTIGKSCFVGLGSNIVGVTIGDNVVVGAGSLVLSDFKGNQTIFGSPAKAKEEE